MARTLDGNSARKVLQIQTRSTREFPAICGYLAARCNSLRVSGRPVLILATGIASESEVRWTEKCTSSFHLNPSSCRISCFLYVRAFLASINLRCASEFGLHWRNRIVVVAIDGLPRHVMRYINLRYLLTYFLIKKNPTANLAVTNDICPQCFIQQRT